MRQKFLLFTCLVLLGGAVKAQTISISYTSVPGDFGTDTVMVYMRSASPGTVDVNAVNFSFAFKSSCATYLGFESIFTAAWTSFSESTLLSPVSTHYGAHNFNRRLNYGNAYIAGFPGTYLITLPDNSQPPLQVMKVIFDGSCSHLIYMEDIIENPVNQISIAPGFVSVPYSVTPFNNAFPVEIVSFEANVIDYESVQLAWTTANEQNNDFFQIEKSLDGDVFKEVPNGKVDGAGNSSVEQEYDFLDRGQMANVVYYRLKQVDFDGSFTLSNVVDVHINNLRPPLSMAVTTFPNPTADGLFVEIDTRENLQYEITLMDTQGRILQKKTSMFGPSYIHREKLNLGNYPTGMYLVTIADFDDSGEAYTQRIIKK